MICINLDEVERNLSAYLKRVEAGETLVIARDNKPVVELRPIKSEPMVPRPFGLCKGEFRVPDDFDTPLPEYIIDEFEEK